MLVPCPHPSIHSQHSRRTNAVWATCPYVSKDGQFNPDGRLVNDVGEFDDMANAVLYNSLAWALNGSSVYAARVASYVSTWFLDDATYMTPNLNYAQMNRGPKGQNGTHTGLLYVVCPSFPRKRRCARRRGAYCARLMRRS